MKALLRTTGFLLMSLFFWIIPVTLKGQVSPEIISIVENSRSSGAFWGVQVRDREGVILEDLNGEKVFRPASNLKLITAGVLLDRFGPDFRFATHLYGTGELIDSVWTGDLMVRGSGDPTISGQFYEGHSLHVFEKWVETLKEMGIQKISGDLIGFDGLFDDVPYPRGWEWDDLSYYYAPEISALSFNSNAVDLEVIADGPVGSIPRIEWSPLNTPYVNFVNEQLITPAATRFDESYRRILGTNTIVLRSTLPQGYYETEPLSVSNPSAYFMDTLYRYMIINGIEIEGNYHINSDYYALDSLDQENIAPLDIHLSEPLYKIVEWFNRESDNFYTEMLIKLLGHQNFNAQGTTELGLKVLKEYMHEMNMDTSAVLLRDGSGMAGATMIPLNQLNQYLHTIQEKEYFPYFSRSLAVAGRNGTLGHRFRNSRIRDQFYGKTGFISGVRALSGYLTTQSGDTLTVSIMTNNYTVQTSQVDLIHRQILEFLHSRY